MWSDRRLAVGLTINDSSVAMAIMRPSSAQVVAVTEVRLTTGLVAGDCIHAGGLVAEAIRAAAATLEISDFTEVALCLPNVPAAEQRPVRFKAGRAAELRVNPMLVRNAGAAVAMAGLRLARCEPIEAALARVAIVATEPGSIVELVARSGWTLTAITVSPRLIDCRSRRLDQFERRTVIRRGGEHARPGEPVDPFGWPRRFRPLAPTALLAASTAMALHGVPPMTSTAAGPRYAR